MIATNAAPAVKVSLQRARERELAALALVPGGAKVALGEPVNADQVAESIVPAAHTLFGPRGAAVTADGALWVADTGHHRLLAWPTLPTRDNQPASWLFGQPDFDREGRNAQGPVSALSLNVPTGICACGPGLAVADAWNHRVLIWHRAPRASHVPPDVVLGQADFNSGLINRGLPDATAQSLYWPYGVYWDGLRLWVADTGNRRVLRFDGLPQSNGTPAALVLGQTDFRQRDENAGAVSRASLRWPHAVTHWQGQLVVADAGNNRLLLWAQDPTHNQAPSTQILGQANELALDHNRGEYWPTAGSFNMPYGLAVQDERLYVADTANSRVLRFDSPALALAQGLAGQRAFCDKGDNRWQAVGRDSLCWPYALCMQADTCIVVDSGNNRVLLWDVVP